MTIVLAEDVATVAKQPMDGRVELRADKKLIARLAVVAARRGLGVSAYVRMAVSKELELDEQQLGIKRGRK
jgi:hypothetical protein